MCNPETGDKQALSGATELKPCPAGSFCEPSTLEVTSVNNCPAGSVCPEGTAFPRPCPPGTLQLNDECAPCPAGQACTLYGQTKANYEQCFAGHFCEGRADTPTHAVAPPGTYTKAGAAKAEVCGVNTYNNFAGQSEVSLCVINPCVRLCTCLAACYFEWHEIIAWINIAL